MDSDGAPQHPGQQTACRRSDCGRCRCSAERRTSDRLTPGTVKSASINRFGTADWHDVEAGRDRATKVHGGGPNSHIRVRQSRLVEASQRDFDLGRRPDESPSISKSGITAARSSGNLARSQGPLESGAGLPKTPRMGRRPPREPFGKNKAAAQSNSARLATDFEANGSAGAASPPPPASRSTVVIARVAPCDTERAPCRVGNEADRFHA